MVCWFFLVASAVYKDTNLPIDEHCRYKDFFVIDDFILLQFFVFKEKLLYICVSGIYKPLCDTVTRALLQL